MLPAGTNGSSNPRTSSTTTASRWLIRRSEVTHVRLDIYPDGGLARVRLWGELSEDGRHRLIARWFDLLPASQAQRILVEECGLNGDQAAQIIAGRPVTGQDKLPDALRALPHC